MAAITHKKGDTLEWISNVTVNSVAADITNWTIRAHIRDSSDTLLYNMSITKSNPTDGIFSMSATAAQTDSWTAGGYSVDIEFTNDAGVVFSTETFNFTLTADITHD